MNTIESLTDIKSDLLLDIYFYEKEIQKATTEEQVKELRDKINLAYNLLAQCD